MRHLTSVAVAISLLTVAPTASAHTDPVGASLEDGGRVEEMPAVFEIQYDGPVDIAGSVLLQHEEGFAEVAYVRPTPTSLSFTLPGGADGWYRLRWSTVAEDGHVAEETLTFLVWDGDSAAPSQPDLRLPTLAGSLPADGSPLEPGMGEVVLMFEGLSPGLTIATSLVSDTAGSVPLGEFPVVAETSVPLPDLPEGRHRVAWEVTYGGIPLASGGVVLQGSNLTSNEGATSDPPPVDGLVEVGTTAAEAADNAAAEERGSGSWLLILAPLVLIAAGALLVLRLRAKNDV